MAIQVWDGTKYVDAELGRFGPSGTLKEALVWDGTKYVKVWPTGPSWVPYRSTITGPGLSPTVTFFVPPGAHRLVVRHPPLKVTPQFLLGSDILPIQYDTSGPQHFGISEVNSPGTDYGLRFIVQSGVGPFDAEYMIEAM